MAYIVKCKCEGARGVAHLDGWSDFLAAARAWSPYWICIGCNRYFKLVDVKGRRSPEHVCGAKCLASKGPTCTCSCAGKNHGRAYA